MKQLKKIFVLVLTVIVLGLPFAQIKALEAGEITVDKIASAIGGDSGRKSKVVLTVRGESFSKTTALDVVLILDRSSSMDDQIKSEGISRMAATKTAAKELVDLLLPTNATNDVRVGIAVYASDYLQEYSSSALSNDATALKMLIDDIPPTVYNQGTNIQTGLNHAGALLGDSDNRQTVVILLSDGMATFYTENGNRYGTGEDDSRACINSGLLFCYEYGKKPSVAALEEATFLKENGTTIYTIGFDVDSTAREFLKNVATSATNYYASSNTDDLKDAFSDIVLRINKIASNGQVVDIIPANFILDEESLVQQYGESVSFIKNDDGTTTITWNIGDIEAGKDITLEYIVEAKDEYYGNMYTNQEAILTGTATDGNTFYGSLGAIILTFPKPTHLVSVLANNDGVYQVSQGSLLEVSVADGVLKNDSQLKQLDGIDVDIENELRVVADSISCGVMSDVVLNQDGTFTYQTNKDCVGDVTFQYQVLSSFQDGDNTKTIASNVATVTITVLKETTTYTVQYLERGTDDQLALEKSGSGYVYEEIEESPLDIDGYEIVNPNGKLELQTSNNVITFYYQKRSDLTYEIHYYYDGELDDTKTDSYDNQTFSDIIDAYPDQAIDGYVLDKEVNVPLTITTDENIMEIHYKKGTYQYRVEYYFDGVLDDLLTDYLVAPYQQIIAEFTNKNKDGYEFDYAEGLDLEISYEEDENVIRAYYKSLPTPPQTGITVDNQLQLIVGMTIMGIGFSILIVRRLMDRKQKKINV